MSECEICYSNNKMRDFNYSCKTCKKLYVSHAFLK